MYPRLYIYIYIALCVICLSVTFRIKTEAERKLSFFRVVHRSRIGGNDSAMENKMFTLAARSDVIDPMRESQGWAKWWANEA